MDANDRFNNVHPQIVEVVRRDQKFSEYKMHAGKKNSVWETVNPKSMKKKKIIKIICTTMAS